RHVFDFGSKWQTTSRALATIAGVFVVFLSFRSLTNAGASPWWSIGPLLAATILAATVSWRTKARAYIFAAGLLFYIAVSLWWLLVAQFAYSFPNFLLVNLIANSLAGLIWLWLDLRARSSEGSIGYYFSFHNLTATFVLGVFSLFVILNFTDLSLAAAPGLT